MSLPFTTPEDAPRKSKLDSSAAHDATGRTSPNDPNGNEHHTRTAHIRVEGLFLAGKHDLRMLKHRRPLLRKAFCEVQAGIFSMLRELEWLGCLYSV